jgi:signal transduction histidine kinase
MKDDNSYYIRPAGRHILTIGSDLIRDKYAAIVELVKNAYDADSPDVEITFKSLNDKKNIEICISDRGHGMSRDTVINKWLVPSTNDKLIRKNSPNGRIMQGRKGIGRYAASILGDSLLLQTTTTEGDRTEVIIEWKDFEKAEYLNDVEILVNTTKSNQVPGTTLTITGGKKYLSDWNEDQVDKLKFELRKLIPPLIPELSTNSEEEFQIFLHFVNIFKDQKSRITEQIKPYPIIQLFDYRISGTIDRYGKGLLYYRNQRARNTIEEKIEINLDQSTDCGKLAFDIRVYDREIDAIDQLIKRGLRDEQGDYLGKLQARQLLNDYNGIGVFRNGFRIRPMGDPDYDWLKLNMKRIQNPSLRIGSNQVIGFVTIESEELSGLIEKSARDGLRENFAYKSLIDIAAQVINELELRRFEYRKKAGLSRTTVKIERQLENLFAFDDLKKDVRIKLVKSGLSDTSADEIIKIITLREDKNNEIADNIRKTVAIYQGQATLGKIINVILHEGRRPLNFFKNQIPNLNYWVKEYYAKHDPMLLDDIVQKIGDIGENANVLVELFSRIDPLAAGKRGPKNSFLLVNSIFGAFHVFEKELNNNKIDYQVKCPKDLFFMGWQQDIYVIMVNLIDNSIYWIKEKKPTLRRIEVVVSNSITGLEYIDYRDTGPGIETHLIESDVIFEPEFSTKPEGTGLGLAIAGEAASRNGLELEAFASDTGAYFRLEPKGEVAK